MPRLRIVAVVNRRERVEIVAPHADKIAALEWFCAYLRSRGDSLDRIVIIERIS